MDGNYRTIKYTNKHGEQCVLRPSDEQLRIIVSDMRQDQKIIACAGSGKTTTLVARLKFLIESGVDPQSIIISTFNVEAGRHIMNRVIELVGSASAKLITIGNIDKIAFKLYSQYIKENSKKSLKKFGLSVKEYCFELFKFLQTREGIKHVLDKYQYFFFDEFQDVNQLQYDILMLFKKHGCYLIVIGDDAQNIYGWRDSRIDIIQNKIDEDIKKFQGTQIKTYMLSTNYRCSKPITLFSNEIIVGSDNLIQKNMRHFDRPGVEEQNKPYLQCYKGLYQQNEEIIMQIKKKLKKYSMRDIAILCPTNQPLKFFEEALEKHNQKHSDQQLVYVSLIGIGSPANNQQRKMGSDGRPIDRITLSTIHRAKGLEWKVVFFIGVNDEFFPTNFMRTASNQVTRLDECRRLFYVGCTRAINELHFSMTKNTKCHKACRFFSSIPSGLYEKDIEIIDSDVKFNNDTVEKEFERDISVKTVIEDMDHHDLDRLDKYLKGIKEGKYQFIHKSIELENNEITRNNLFNDLSLFMNLYIQRSLGEKMGVKNAFTYETGRVVLFSMFWRSEKAEIVAKYQEFFSNRLLDFDEMVTPKQFIDSFNLCNSIGKQEIDDFATEVEEKILEEMFVTIRTFMDTSDIPYNFIQHVCVDDASQQMKEYFPDDFDKTPYVKSFKSFCNEKKRTQDIINDVYVMSKCGQLVELTRKVLYRNDFEKLNVPKLEENVNIFIEYLKTFNFKKLRSNHTAQHGILLKGTIDLIADSTIYEIKTSQYQYISKEYILQLLAYAALMKVTEDLDVTRVVFYNPFLGKISVFDVSEWTFAKEFIGFLVNKSNQNADEIINDPYHLSEAASTAEQESSYLSEKIGDGGQTKMSTPQQKKNDKPIFNVKEFKQPTARVKPVDETADSQKIQSSEGLEKSFVKKQNAKIEYSALYTSSKKLKKTNESVCIEIEDNEEKKVNLIHNNEDDEVEDFASFQQNIQKKLKNRNNYEDGLPLELDESFFEENDQMSQEQQQFNPAEEQKNQFIQID